MGRSPWIQNNTKIAPLGAKEWENFPMAVTFTFLGIHFLFGNSIYLGKQRFLKVTNYGKV